MKVKEIIKTIISKLGDYEKFDEENNKLIFGNEQNEIKQIFFCWRLTLNILKNINLNKNTLIVCHEPFIYNVKPFLTKQPKKIKLKSNEDKLSMIKASEVNIARFHLSLDSSPHGTNKTLIGLLGLTEKENFKYYSICELDSQENAMKFIKRIKKRLNAPHVSVIGNINRKIKRVLLIAGGGASKEFLSFALINKCDALISGDSYMEVQYFALENKIMLIDPGHQFLEIPGIKNFTKVIKSDLQGRGILIDFIEDKGAVNFFKSV